MGKRMMKRKIISNTEWLLFSNFQPFISLCPSHPIIPLFAIQFENGKKKTTDKSVLLLLLILFHFSKWIIFVVVNCQSSVFCCCIFYYYCYFVSVDVGFCHLCVEFLFTLFFYIPIPMFVAYSMSSNCNWKPQEIPYNLQNATQRGKTTRKYKTIAKVSFCLSFRQCNRVSCMVYPVRIQIVVIFAIFWNMIAYILLFVNIVIMWWRFISTGKKYIYK